MAPKEIELYKPRAIENKRYKMLWEDFKESNAIKSRKYFDLYSAEVPVIAKTNILMAA
jgi:hypothetical protein